MRKETILDERNVPKSDKVNKENVIEYLLSLPVFSDFEKYYGKLTFDNLFIIAEHYLDEPALYIACVESKVIIIIYDSSIVIRDWTPFKYKVTRTVVEEVSFIEELDEEQIKFYQELMEQDGKLTSYSIVERKILSESNKIEK